MMDSIKSIEKRYDGEQFYFVVTITDGHKAALPVEIVATDLLSYTAFQKAVLATYGVYFRNDDYEAGRGRGAAEWRDEIEHQLRRAKDAPERITEVSTR